MGPDILIFDDDACFAGLLQEVIRGQGLRSKYFPNGEDAVAHIERERPRMVIVDLMMPGMDGLSICRALKNGPEGLRETKVAVVTGKAFREDQARADGAGADLFFQKPLDIPRFSKEVHRLVPALPEKRTQGRGSWRIRFYKSGPEPGCLSVRHGKRLFVFDAAAGIERIFPSPTDGVEEIWVLLSKVDAEHASGLSVLRDWALCGLCVNIAAPADEPGRLRGIVKGLLPAGQEGRIRVFPLHEGTHVIPAGPRLFAMSMCHPGACLGYRLEADGHSLVVIPGNELVPGWEAAWSDWGEKLTRFCKGAGLLVHDARRSGPDEPLGAMTGHSSPEQAFRLALRARARRLVLHGVDPQLSETARRELEATLESRRSEEMGAPDCVLGTDGLELEVD